MPRQGRAATSLLVAVAVLFVGVSQIPDPGFWLLLLRAGCEAALVGGLADWFAVTALFRRPLGLPIPHTAVVTRNKDRIGQGLGAFVEQHILDPELIIARVRRAQVARRLGLWLSRPRHATLAAERIASALPLILDALGEHQARELLRQGLTRHLAKADLSFVLGAGLRLAREAHHHHELFDRVLAAARDYLLANESRVYQAVESRSRWWVPSRIDRRMAQTLLHAVAELLADMNDRDHEVRRKLDVALAQLIDDLEHSPEVAGRVAALRDQVLASGEVQAYLAALWDEGRAAIERGARQSDSALRRALAEMLRSLGLALRRDPAIRAWFDQRCETLIEAGVTPFRAEIGRFIAEVVRGWEAETIAARIEGAVGRDLQFIRINGTVVGAIVGCGLFLLSWFAF